MIMNGEAVRICKEFAVYFKELPRHSPRGTTEDGVGDRKFSLCQLRNILGSSIN